MTEKKSYYEILEISENATFDEIKRAYRRLSLKYHPDKNIHNVEMGKYFTEISEAFETLGNAEKKREYDMKRRRFSKPSSSSSFSSSTSSSNSNSNSNQFNQGNHHFPQHSNQYDPFSSSNSSNPSFSTFYKSFSPEQFQDMFQNIFSGGAGERFTGGNHENGYNKHTNHSNQSYPFSNHFSNNIPMFQPGGLSDHFSRQLQKPTPILHRVKVTMEQVLTGTTLPVEIERWIVQQHNDHGVEKVFEKETIYVTIPQGIDNGEIIILRERGNVVNELCKGDIKLCIEIENTTLFKRNGLDLVFEKQITLKESLCGLSFELTFLNSKPMTIHNKPGNIIPSDFIKVIPGMGLTRDSNVGNLLIHFKVQFPSTLTSEQISSLNDIL